MSKPEPNLAHMPWPVMHHIAGYIDTFSKLSLGRSCRGFHGVVGTSVTHFISFEYQYTHELLEVTICADVANPQPIREPQFNTLIVRYTQQDNDVVVKNGDHEKLIEGAHFISLAASDFATFVRNPKVVIGSLKIWRMWGRHEHYTARDRPVLQPFLTKLHEAISTFGHLLTLSALRIEEFLTEDEAMMMLTLVKPGILQAITLMISDDDGLPQLIQTEQWKQATEACLFSRPAVSEMAHFRKILLYSDDLSKDEVKEFIQVARNQGDNLQEYVFSSLPQDERGFFQFFHETLSRLPGFERGPENNQYLLPITNSNNYIQFECGRGDIRMEKVTADQMDEFEFDIDEDDEIEFDANEYADFLH